MLEALHPGLGWKVFRRYPEQFASPDAVESWCLVAALLYTEVGLQPDEVNVFKGWWGGLGEVAAVAAPGACREVECLEQRHAGDWAVARRWQLPSLLHDLSRLLFATPHLTPNHPTPHLQITALFARHQPLFKQAVLQPDNLRRLFVWLRQDLGLDQRGVLKLVNRCPLVLQVGGQAGGRVGWDKAEQQHVRKAEQAGDLMPSACFRSHPLECHSQPARPTHNQLSTCLSPTPATHPCPSSLPAPQTDVEGVLKPRVQWLVDLGMPQVRLG